MSREIYRYSYDELHDAITASVKVKSYRPNSGDDNLWRTPAYNTEYAFKIDVDKFRSELLKVTTTPDRDRPDYGAPKPWQPDPKTLQVLASALHKFAPDLAKDIISKWSEQDRALNDFLEILRKT